MISVIVWIEAGNEGARARLASRTLAALVPLAVDGLVRDVSLVADVLDGTLLDLADESGAALYSSADKAAGLAAMRADSGLVLDAGVGFGRDLVDEISGYLVSGQGSAAIIRQRGASWLGGMLWPETGGIIAPRALLVQSASLAPKQLKRRLVAPLVFRSRLERR